MDENSVKKVFIERWDCGAGCRHTTEEIAKRCIKAKASRSMQEIRRVGLERKRKAYWLRKEGMTFKQVGEKLGVSVERARQLVNAYDRKRRMHLNVTLREVGAACRAIKAAQHD